MSDRYRPRQYLLPELLEGSHQADTLIAEGAREELP